MSHRKQSFAPYAAIIIVAIVLIALANAIVVYNNNIAEQGRSQSIIDNQQQVISSLSNTTAQNNNILKAIYNGHNEGTTIVKQIENLLSQGTNASLLSHGAILFLINNQTVAINNNTKKLDTLIIAHNDMVKAIEEAAGIHTPTVINKNTVIHNTFCSIKVVTPKCNHKR